MNAFLPASSVLPASLSPVLRGRLADRVRVVAPALRQRFASQWAVAEVDLILVHYIYGLFATVMPDAEPDTRIGMMRELGRLVLDVDTLRHALHTAPPAGDSPIAREAELARAVIAAETFGGRDAQAVLAALAGDPNQTIEPNSNIKPIRRTT